MSLLSPLLLLHPSFPFSSEMRVKESLRPVRNRKPSLKAREKKAVEDDYMTSDSEVNPLRGEDGDESNVSEEHVGSDGSEDEQRPGEDQCLQKYTTIQENTDNVPRHPKKRRNLPNLTGEKAIFDTVSNNLLGQKVKGKQKITIEVVIDVVRSKTPESQIATRIIELPASPINQEVNNTLEMRAIKNGKQGIIDANNEEAAVNPEHLVLKRHVQDLETATASETYQCIETFTPPTSDVQNSRPSPSPRALLSHVSMPTVSNDADERVTSLSAVFDSDVERFTQDQIAEACRTALEMIHQNTDAGAPDTEVEEGQWFPEETVASQTSAPKPNLTQATVLVTQDDAEEPVSTTVEVGKDVASTRKSKEKTGKGRRTITVESDEEEEEDETFISVPSTPFKQTKSIANTPTRSANQNGKVRKRLAVDSDAEYVDEGASPKAKDAKKSKANRSGQDEDSDDKSEEERSKEKIRYKPGPLSARNKMSAKIATNVKKDNGSPRQKAKRKREEKESDSEEEAEEKKPKGTPRKAPMMWSREEEQIIGQVYRKALCGLQPSQFKQELEELWQRKGLPTKTNQDLTNHLRKWKKALDSVTDGMF